MSTYPGAVRVLDIPICHALQLLTKFSIYGLRKVSIQRNPRHLGQSWILRWNECLDRHRSYRIHRIDCWGPGIPAASPHLCWSYPLPHDYGFCVCPHPSVYVLDLMFEIRFITEVDRMDLSLAILDFALLRYITSMEKATTLVLFIVRCRVRRIHLVILWHSGTP